MAPKDPNVGTSRQDVRSRIACASSISPPGRRRRLPRHLGQFRRPIGLRAKHERMRSWPAYFEGEEIVMSPSARTALFIDGANLHATARALGFDIDYRRLLREFQDRGA